MSMMIRCAGRLHPSSTMQEPRGVLAIQTHALGPEHPDTLRTRQQLAACLKKQSQSLRS